MTPEQVTKRKARSYALIGAGIAAFVMAYQYAQPVVGRAEPPPAIAPYLFGAVGVVCLVIGGIMAFKASKVATPAATTDFSSPQGKKVAVLMVIGFAALAGSYFVDYVVAKNETLSMLLSVGLLAVMIVCFLFAASLAKKMRNASTTGAVE